MKTLQQVEPRTPISIVPTNLAVSGSYYLVTNLPGVAASDGITISANDVDLDLNGFVLAGAPGSGTGISVPAFQTNLVVRNGKIRGWGSLGVLANSVNSRFENLHISGNSGTGLQVGSGSLVTGCELQNNGAGIFTGTDSMVKDCIAQSTGTGIITGDASTVSVCIAAGNLYPGISTGNGCTIKECTARANNPGIYTGDGCTLIGCSAINNSSNGISTGFGCTVRDCTVRNSAANGMVLSSGCTISGCTAYLNGSDGINTLQGCTVTSCTAYANTGNGITSGAYCTVERCTVHSNTGDGIRHSADCRIADNAASSGAGSGAGIRVLTSFSRIDGNVVNQNTVGIRADAGPNLIVRNLVRGNTTNYVFGTLEDLGATNANFDLSKETNAWRNFNN